MMCSTRLIQTIRAEDATKVARYAISEMDVLRADLAAVRLDLRIACAARDEALLSVQSMTVQRDRLIESMMRQL